jgi:hypothetical protein
MTDSHNIRWKRLAIEAPAIVISILLAFAIDAWWEERQATEVQEIPDFGTMLLPNSNELVFLIQARGLWYESSIVESNDLLVELEEIQALVQAEMAR